MLSYPPAPSRPTFASVLASFACGDGLRATDALAETRLRQLGADHGVSFATGANDVWSPAVTLWAFLTQCLATSKSCVAAVARVLVLRVALGLPPCSANTGAYCKARAKLPEAFLRQLALDVGTQVEGQAPDAWRWHRRRVLLADGAELSLPDTKANQQAYPQPKTQKPGLGFPRIRLVVLLAFATAGLLGGALGPCQGKETGETALFRTLLGQINAGDVVVADRYYCSYWMIALLLQHGADACFRLHQRRRADFSRGQRLGPGDHVVTWAKPARPAWLDQETYEQLAAQLTMREVLVQVERPGYRVRQLVVATTLTDAHAFPQGDIADLYHRRWHVELDLRNIKVTLKMDVLSCQSPEMVRKEVWTHLLAYNLVRQVLAQAALVGQRTPRQLSFAGGVQTVNAFRWLLLCGAEVRRVAVQALWTAVASHEVGKRPGRVEPREVKRRRKVRLLTKPRAERRAELLEGKEGAGK